MEVGQGQVSTDEDDRRNDLVASALGLLALALACVPTAPARARPRRRPRQRPGLADARNWTGLRWFGLASAVGLGPVYVLARMAPTAPGMAGAAARDARPGRRAADDPGRRHPDRVVDLGVIRSPA